MWKWESDSKAHGVIVMIHGELEHHARYGWLIEMWRSRGYHVIMGDLPGQGMAKRTERGHIESFNHYLIEVKGWIEAAYQFGLPVFLFGHGMGGLIAIRMLQRVKWELAGVILSSPTLALKHSPSKVNHLMASGLNKLTPEHKFNFGFPIEMATRNQDIIELDREDALYVNKVSVRWYRELLQAIKQVPLENKYFPDIPVLVLQAGEDHLVDEAVVKKWFRDLDLSEMHYKRWPGLYHELFNEPEKEEVFLYTESFARNRLRSIGYDV